MITIVGANTEYNLNTHSDLEKFLGEKEKDVLFLPFSFFGIKDFAYDAEKKRYNIKLIYLGKFKKDFEKKIKFDIKKDVLPEPYFKYLFEKSGLIEESKIHELKIKDAITDGFSTQVRNTNKRCCSCIK